MAAYKADQTRAARRRAAKQPMLDPLDSYDMSDGGTIVLIPTPADNVFAVMLGNADFTAAVLVAYDIDDEGPAPANVTMFQGDAGKAFKLARTWLKELTDDEDFADPFGSMSGEALVGLPTGQRDRVRRSLPADAPERVRSIASRTAANLRKSERFEPAESDMAWLDEYPDSLALLVDLYVSACTAKRRDELLIPTVQSLMVLQLEFVRYEVERGWDWATDLVRAFEKRIVALADGASLEVKDWSFLPSTFSRARLPVSPALAEAFAAADASIAPDVAPETLPGNARCDREDGDGGRRPLRV
jgi:hypothetical protein